MSKLIGKWMSDSSIMKTITFSASNWSSNADNGRWAIKGDELWLINSDLETGVKWFFKFQGENELLLHDPEDFIYQGNGNYLYLQFTNPREQISLKRVLKN